MTTIEQDRILIVDPNPLFLKKLAQELRTRNFDVVATASSMQAFHILRDRQRPVDWLFSRATLPGLIDGWILADEYHDSHPTRAAVIAAPQARVCAQGHIVLQDPSPAAVLEALGCIMALNQAPEMPSQTGRDEKRLAA